MTEGRKLHVSRRDDPRDLGHSERSACVVRLTTTTPEESMPTASLRLPVEAIMAGFIVWLAHQHSPVTHRPRCADAVERFLRWRRDQREREVSHLEDEYYAQMQRSGANLAHVVQVRAAIELFRRYLRTTE
jgi:hypothetical protein